MRGAISDSTVRPVVIVLLDPTSDRAHIPLHRGPNSKEHADFEKENRADGSPPCNVGGRGSILAGHAQPGQTT